MWLVPPMATSWSQPTPLQVTFGLQPTGEVPGHRRRTRQRLNGPAWLRPPTAIIYWRWAERFTPPAMGATPGCHTPYRPLTHGTLALPPPMGAGSSPQPKAGLFTPRPIRAAHGYPTTPPN